MSEDYHIYGNPSMVVPAVRMVVIRATYRPGDDEVDYEIMPVLALVARLWWPITPAPGVEGLEDAISVEAAISRGDIVRGPYMMYDCVVMDAKNGICDVFELETLKQPIVYVTCICPWPPERDEEMLVERINAACCAVRARFQEET